MTYQKYNTFKNYFWILLVPLTLLFTLIVILRRKISPYFCKGFENVKIICVGNIHSGGSGKTPIVLAIAKSLDLQKTIILSRGYGGKFIKTFEQVDLKRNEGAFYYGDEAWMLAKKTEIAVFVAKNRSAALHFFNQNYKNHTILLDDGFQELKIKKDFSIVVVNGDKNTEEICLPYGELREPYLAFQYADAIFLINEKKEWSDLILKYIKPTALFFPQKKVYNESKLSTYGRCVAFCGIGEPESFYKDLQSFYEVVHFEVFSDHYAYEREDLERLVKIMDKVGVNCLVTTEKDYAKVKSIFYDDSKLNVLKLEYVIEKRFFELLKKALHD